MKQDTAFIKLVNKIKKHIHEIDMENFIPMVENNSVDGILIDIREKYEHDVGFIPGSIHISRGVLEASIETIASSTEQKIYLYCGGGYRSALSADSLQNMGYNKVYSIAGGYKTWCQFQPY